MNIDLNREEVYRILKERFGEGTFRIFYTESDKLWELRNNIKISELKHPPSKESYTLYFDEFK